MTPERWARVTELLEAAAALPPHEREAWLASACDDDTLRDDVRQLLAAYDRDPEYLEQAVDPQDAAVAADRDMLAGRRAGAYRLVRELGRGGMGVVYEAVRDDDAFDRRAAVKMLPGWSAAILAERFRFERRVLAGLDHPGIARLIDAGAIDDGAPYCVMELVEGDPIDAWCDAHQIDLAGRVRLVARVCDAVAYAHGHLVVHRDLKPSNILVTADGQPKLLDFGIATLLDAERGVSIGTTRTGFTSFTPEFASPEQVRGDRVTTGADVYSLGVLLYLLLAGKKPYDLRGVSPLDALRIVCEVDPPRPSAVATRAVAAGLTGDLDTIVMKALRKAPEDRYGSAGDLAADLRAWLEHRPIAAAPASWTYRARRFVRRNTVAVGAAAMVMLALVAGAVATAWQAQVAERERARADARFNDVRQLANAVVGPLHDAIAKVPGSTEARQVLVKEALTYLDRLSAQAGDDAALLTEVGDAYEKIGDVQGNLYGPNLGDSAGATTSYGRLLELRRRVVAVRPDDLAARGGLVNAEIRIADIALGENRSADALAAYQRAIDVVGAPAQVPNVEAAALTASRAYGRMGVALNWAGRAEEATAAFANARTVITPWATRADASALAQTELLSLLGNAGDVDYLAERYEAAHASYAVALEMARAAAVRTPGVRTRRMVYLTATRAAMALQEIERLDEAAVLTAESVAIQRELAAGDPKDVRLQFDLAASLQGQGVLEFKRTRLDESARLVAESLRMYEAGMKASPSSTDQRFDIAATWAWRGRVEAARGRLRDGIAALRTAMVIYAEPGVAARKPSEHFEARQWLGDALLAWSRAGGGDAARNQAREAYVTAREGLTALSKAGELEPRMAEVLKAIEAQLATLTQR